MAEKADLSKGGRLVKLFNPPEFMGKVEPGRSYILVDDMITTGSTLAALHSYIRSNGGHVLTSVCMASGTGNDVQLNAD